MAQTNDIFLEENDYVDFSSANIRELSEKLFAGNMTQAEIIEKAYRYVENEIPHSKDINKTILPFKASDVLKNKTGICFAKSNLLCALLRLQGIRTGFCYQHLVLSDTKIDKNFCLHGLNGVYYNGKFLRLDARGRRKAVFSLTNPKEAFEIRENAGEYNVEGVFARQLPNVIKAFAECKTRPEFWEKIPDTVTVKSDVL